MKPDADADTEDRLASHASAGPSGPASQQPAAMQWVETDDLGDSKRQVPAIPKPSMPNGGSNQLQSGLQQPQGGSQQPQGSLQPPPGTLRQPQGSLHQPPGNLQQPQGSDLTAHAALQQPQGKYGMTQGFSEQPGDDAEPAEPTGDFTQQSGVDVKQEMTNTAEVETQHTANLLLRSYRECFHSCALCTSSTSKCLLLQGLDHGMPLHFEVQADGQLSHDQLQLTLTQAVCECRVGTCK